MSRRGTESNRFSSYDNNVQHNIIIKYPRRLVQTTEVENSLFSEEAYGKFKNDTSAIITITIVHDYILLR